MKFTERDTDMIRWINGHGFATIRQIARWMGSSYQAAQRRTQILADADFLEHRWPFRGERVYLPTKRAAARSGDELPPLNRITHGSYVHDLELIDLALWLAADTGGAFTPERRIRHERGLTGVGISGHVADGLLKLGDDKPIAIELELSTKAKRRLAKIIRGYLGDLSVSEVWYFAGSGAVRGSLERAAGDHAFIKIRDWPPDRTLKPCASQTESRPGTDQSVAESHHLNL